MILTHQLKSQVDLQWTFHDVHATNHNEFDEIQTKLSWSISTNKTIHSFFYSNHRYILESNQDHVNVHKVTSMLLVHDWEYHMDSRERLHKDRGHLINKIDIILLFFITDLHVFWQYFLVMLLFFHRLL